MNENDLEKMERGFKRYEAARPRFEIEIKIKIQLGPVGIIYPQLGPSALYFDFGLPHGLVQIGRLWIDW